MIFLAAVLDSADGYIARKLKMISSIGRELDSLADVISFGLAPIMLLFSHIGENILTILCGFVYLACGALRLARFNVYGSKEFFEGLPIPAAAILTSSSILYLPLHISPLLAVFIGLLMISPFLYPSPKVSEGRRPIFLSLLIGFLLFVLLLYLYLPISSVFLMVPLVFSISLVYAILSPLLFKLFQ